MPGWDQYAGWMGFSRLDDGAGLTAAFTLAYKITDDSSELWSGRFGRIKQKHVSELAGAVAVLREAVPALTKSLGLDMSQTLFIPAISSGESVASDRSFVSLMARASAEAAGGALQLDALSKRPHRPIHGLYQATERGAELDNAQYAAQHVSATHVLIVDDLITRGGTMSRIAQALLRENPSLKIGGIALGKTDRRAYWGNLTNDHVPARWDTLWRDGQSRFLAKKAG